MFFFFFFFFFIYMSSRCFLLSYESVGILVQEEKQKQDFRPSWISFRNDFFFFFFFFFFFWLYGPLKNISLISSRSLIKGGRKPENPGKKKTPDHPKAELGFATCYSSEARTTAVRNLMDLESTLLSTRLREGGGLGTILAIFDLQVTPRLPTKFRVNWHRGVG